jgi:hypothetical protein
MLPPAEDHQTPAEFERREDCRRNFRPFVADGTNGTGPPVPVPREVCYFLS